MHEKQNPDQKILPEVVKTLVSLIEQKGTYISGHAERVAGNCVLFAKELNLPKHEIDKIYLAGLFHDIGMVFIPLEIIQKPAKLTDDEMSAVRQHPMVAEKVLSPLSFLRDVIPLIRHHHEMYDGSGYPDAIKGEEIPIGSRVLCLVDTFEAMIAPRSHRPALEVKDALEIIEKEADGKYDGKLTEKFIDFIQSSPDVSKEIKDAKRLRDAVKQVVLNFKRGVIELPVLPKIVYEIRDVIRNPLTTIDNVASVVERDAVISIKLISAANSPIYRGTDKFHTVKQAIPRLGIKKAYSIIETIANKSLYKTGNEEFMGLMEKLWLHSLACAYSSRAIAHRLHIADPEKLFLMGLIHDIGKVLLIKSLTDIFTKQHELDMDSVNAAIQEYHGPFGAALLQRWNFTAEFIRVAELHEGPRFFETTPKEVLVVSLANLLTRKIGFSLFNDEDIDLCEVESTKLLGMDTALVDDIVQDSRNMIQEVAASF